MFSPGLAGRRDPEEQGHAELGHYTGGSTDGKPACKHNGGRSLGFSCRRCRGFHRDDSAWKTSRNSISGSELEGTLESATELIQQKHNCKMLSDFVYSRTKPAKMLTENSCFTPSEQNLRFGWKWHFLNTY